MSHLLLNYVFSMYDVLLICCFRLDFLHLVLPADSALRFDLSFSGLEMYPCMCVCRFQYLCSSAVLFTIMLLVLITKCGFGVSVLGEFMKIGHDMSIYSFQFISMSLNISISFRLSKTGGKI